MHYTQLAHLIANEPSLRTRIESIVRRRSAESDPTTVEQMMLTNISLDAIAWEVAANPAIFSTVHTALDSETPDITAAVNEVTDSDLEYVVCQQVTCIAP